MNKLSILVSMCIAIAFCQLATAQIGGEGEAPEVRTKVISVIGYASYAKPIPALNAAIIDCQIKTFLAVAAARLEIMNAGNQVLDVQYGQIALLEHTDQGGLYHVKVKRTIWVVYRTFGSPE